MHPLGSNPSDQPQTKKRRRIPYSCICCRSRKVKCDRTKPVCNRCSKASLSCRYDGPSVWAQSDLVPLNNGFLEPTNDTGAVSFGVLQLNSSANHPEKGDFTNGIGKIHQSEFQSKQKSGSPNNWTNTLDSYPLSNGASQIGEVPIRSTESANTMSSIFSTASSTRSRKEMPTVTSSPNIASTITEIAILKKRLEELENNIEARSPGKATDTISLIYDKNGDCSLLLMSKKNRFLCLGSFCYITMWKRDFLVSHLLEDFRRLKMEVRARIKEVSVDLGKSSTNNNLHKQVKLRKQGSKVKLIGSKQDGVVDKTDSEHLARKMAAFFPPEQITNLHLNRFFDYIYPFIPVLDEKGFRDSVSSILSFSNVDGRLELKIDKKLDLVIVATLLVMMRLSYTTLYLANDAQPVSQDSDAFQILEYPINLTVIEYVHFALQNVNYLRKSSIEVLQLLLLIRRYQSISQEDNDGMAATDGYIYNGLICETALSMGLNRNLSENVCDSSIPQVTDVQNPKFNSVCQKLWWSVIEMDITHAMRFGKKPAIHQDDSATELPLFDPSASNSYNLASEKFVIERISKLGKIYPVVERLLRQLHNVKTHAKVVDVKTDLRLLTNLNEQLFGSDPKKYMFHENELLQEIDNLRWRVEIGRFQFLIKYYLLLHYEEKQDMDEYLMYLSDCCNTVISNFENCLLVIKRSTSDLSNYSLVAIQNAIFSLDTSAIFLMYLSIRILLLQDKRLHNINSSDETTGDILSSIHLRICSVMRVVLKMFAMTADHFYYAYRVYGHLKYIVHCAEKGKFPIFNFKSVHNLPNMIEKLSVFQLTELDAKFQQFLNLEIFKEMTDTPALWGVNRSTTSLYYESNLDLPFPETPDVTQIQSLSDYSVRPPTATDGHELIDGSSVDPMSFEDLKDWLSTSEFFDIFEQLGNISPASV